MTTTLVDPTVRSTPATTRRHFPGLTLPARPVLSFTLGLDKSADWHTHSLLGRGRATPIAVADAAAAAGLLTWALTDHVTTEDTWLVEYAAMVRSIERDGVTVRCGVETTVLDVHGRLDLPRRLPYLDHAVVTVVDLPGRSGPVEAPEARERLRTGRITATDVVDEVVAATVASVRHCPARPVVGRLASVLTRFGLDDTLLGEDHLRALAAACRATGGAVEVNERWAAPSARVATCLAAAGVHLVAGSDATTARAVGAWHHVDTVRGTETPELADVVALETDDLPVPDRLALAS